jgi:translation initiation factor 2 subunit 3
MANDKKELETINIGIVGHIDHGKTTLLQRLSGKWTDTHSEELKRGITIKLGYADTVIYENSGEYNIDKKGKAVRHVSFVDAPGHEMLMATMLSGAALIDAAILVIAANEGIKPQTREHLMALQSKKIKNLIVVQNKIDLVDKEQAKKNYVEIKNFLKGKFDNALIIPTSAQQGVNINEIWKTLSNLEIEDRKTEVEPIFVVARSFDINRPGTELQGLKGAVLGGALKQGILNNGDLIEIKPGRAIKDGVNIKYETIKSKITNLFRGSERVDKLTPGGSMSIETELDMSVGKGDRLAGNVLSIEGKLPQLSTKIKINYKLFPEVYGTKGHVEVDKLNSGETLMLSVNTAISGGAVLKADGKEFEIQLRIPEVVFQGDNVGIARNIGGHWRLIGFGEIL